MKKGNSNSGYSASKNVATVGYISSVPMKSTVVTSRSGNGERSYETKSQVSHGDKQTGSYERLTTKEKASSGEFTWKNGTSGVKNEYKTTTTARVGNKQGYTEYHKEERVRDVVYDNKSSGNDGGKNLITYDHDDYGSGGYDGHGSGGYDGHGYGGYDGHGYGGYGGSGVGYDSDSDYGY